MHSCTRSKPQKMLKSLGQRDSQEISIYRRWGQQWKFRSLSIYLSLPVGHPGHAGTRLAGWFSCARIFAPTLVVG